MEKLQRIFKIKVKRRNVKTFLFFLLFSTVIWILVQLGKTYTRIVEFPIEYVNEPLDKIILEENPRVLKVRIRDSGFGIMFYKMFSPSYELDLSKTIEEGNKLIFPLEENKPEVADQLDLNLNQSEIVKDQLVVNFYQKSTKLLPVVSNIEVDFKAGYGAQNAVDIEPDSIKVSGHKQVIDTLEQLETKQLTLKNIHESVKGIVEIDKENLKNISFYEDEVAYTLNVDKFTEGRLTVPVEVINVPENREISIFPKEVTVIYQVNLQDFNKVNRNDFRIISDYKNIQPNEHFLIPKIVSKPDFVKNVRLNVKKVEFVIKQ